MANLVWRNAVTTLLVLLCPGTSLWGQGDPAQVTGIVVDADSGSPIRKAYVSLSTAEDNPAQALATTDGSGQFGFANIPPGRYHLYTRCDGYQQASYGASAPDQAPGVIILHPGERRQDFAFRMISLGVISGKVFDPDGDPLDGAVVSIWIPTFQRGKPGFAQRGATATNDSGEYRITGLAPGRYMVMVNANGRQAIHIQPESAASAAPLDQRLQPQFGVQYFSATERLAEASLLTVAAGKEIEGIDFHMAARQPTTVRGSVVPPVELPPDTFIQLAGTSLDTPDHSLWGFSAGAGAPKYEFEADGVLPGEYLLIASVSVGGQAYRGVQRVLINATGENHATLNLEPGVDLAGTVKIEGGRADPETRVLLSSGDSIPFNSAPPQAHVKVDGSFVIQDVLPGIWDINVQPIPQGGYIKSMRLGRQDVLTEDMVIAAGTKEPLHIVVSPNGGIVEGDVKADSGESAGPAMILAAPDGRYSYVLSFYSAVAADEKGHFQLKGLTPGSYKLYAFNALTYCAWCDPDFLKPFAGQGKSIQITEGVNPSTEVRLIRK
jgi:hypothetical protein